MVIDEGMLRRARESGARMADAQHQAELAKADYHHAVRRLHFAGASLREIADALELSHQRVHQIVEATGGTGGWRSRRKAGTETRCGFCGLPDADVTKLIAGPGIFICDGCVALARQVVAQSRPAQNQLTRLDRAAPASMLKCSFCGKSAQMTTTLVTGPGVYICDECLRICDEVLAAAAASEQ